MTPVTPQAEQVIGEVRTRRLGWRRWEATRRITQHVHVVEYARTKRAAVKKVLPHPPRNTVVQ